MNKINLRGFDKRGITVHADGTVTSDFRREDKKMRNATYRSVRGIVPDGSPMGDFYSEQIIRRAA